MQRELFQIDFYKITASKIFIIIIIFSRIRATTNARERAPERMNLVSRSAPRAFSLNSPLDKRTNARLHGHRVRPT
jgi:hypothetical protein